MAKITAKTIYNNFDFNEDVEEFQFTTVSEQCGEVNCSGEFDSINMDKPVDKFYVEGNCLFIRVKNGVWRK